MILRTRAWQLIAIAMLSGCSQLPVNGPAGVDIAAGASATLVSNPHIVVYNYALVDLCSEVVDYLADIEDASFSKSFGAIRRRASAVRVGVGDVLQVSVFESSKEGLFVPAEATNRQGNFVSLPNQSVSDSGTIFVPYAGELLVTGRTLPEIEREIESKLAKRAVEPQVIISLVEQNTGAVTVLGDTINAGNKIKLSGSGERILDMVSKVGGLKFPAYDAFVTLQRNNRLATVPFPVLVGNPEENIFVEPGDLVYVHREPRKFIAVGAVGGQVAAGAGLVGQFTFDQARLSLNEALARAGGLIDTRADPAQVFLYRIERRKTLEKIGVDLSRFPPNQKFIPTVYRANFRDPSSFFFTQRFPMRNKDTIYVGNSDSTEVTKFLLYLGTATGVATDINYLVHPGGVIK
jgi:polysaccharide export outer membrane protein